MIVAVPVDDEDRVAPGWGRARRVAVADVRDGAITDWHAYEVGWDVLHDEGTEGAHHARVARFLREHAVATVAVAHLGPGMLRMLTAMGVAVRPVTAADARDAVLAAAQGGLAGS